MGGASSKNRSDTSPIETLDKAPVFIQDHDESLENGTFETHNGAPHSISLNKDIIQQRNFLENSPVNSRENVAPSATQIVSQTDRSTPAAQIFSQTDRSTPAAQIFSQTDRSTPVAQIFSKTDRSTPAAQISSQTDRSPLKFDKSNIAQFDKSQNFYSRDKSGIILCTGPKYKIVTNHITVYNFIGTKHITIYKMVTNHITVYNFIGTNHITIYKMVTNHITIYKMVTNHITIYKIVIKHITIYKMGTN